MIADSGAQQGLVLAAFFKMSPLGHFKLQQLPILRPKVPQPHKGPGKECEVSLMPFPSPLPCLLLWMAAVGSIGLEAAQIWLVMGLSLGKE